MLRTCIQVVSDFVYIFPRFSSKRFKFKNTVIRFEQPAQNGDTWTYLLKFLFKNRNEVVYIVKLT